MVNWHHRSPKGGHSGRGLTVKRLKHIFVWRGMTKLVRQVIRDCQICQVIKHENVTSPRLLQPLPIPEEVWYDITMDFITGLPKFGGKDVILVVVDRLSKYAHFISLSHPFIAIQVAHLYIHHMFKLHGTEFLLSLAYHPQIDGQSEVVNRYLETYLRCMYGDQPKDWCS